MLNVDKYEYMPVKGQSSVIKKPHIKTAFTTQELQEFIRCSDPVTGPEYFLSNYFKVQHPVKGGILYKPYDFQKRLIDTYHNYRKSISLLPRQCGKTITAAGYLLWAAMFKADQNILIAAHKFLGASEIMDRIRYGYESVPDFLRCGILEYNKQSITFDNGSKIAAQATTDNTGRGTSISILYCDELAFVRNTIARNFWASITPTLSTGGKAIITSTPNSSEDLFAQLWNDANKTEDEFGETIENGVGVNGFKAMHATWDEHPDRDEAWAAEQRASLGDELFSREVLCEFIIFEETLINQFKLNTLTGKEPTEHQGQVRWYYPIFKDKTYLVALDPSLGTGGDPAAIQIFEANSMTQVGEWTHNKTGIEEQVTILQDICTKLVETTEDIEQVYYSVENNTIGEATLVALRDIGEENISGIFLSETVKLGMSKKYRKGFNTTNTKKLAACAKFKNLIETDKMKIHSKKLVSELKVFIKSGNSYRAKRGEHDDLVTSSLVIVQMMEAIKNFVPSLDDSRDYTDSSLPMPFIMATY